VHTSSVSVIVIHCGFDDVYLQSLTMKARRIDELMVPKISKIQGQKRQLDYLLCSHKHTR